MKTSAAPRLLIGAAADGQVYQSARMLNRHGLITGATGTGKTVTLQILAESLGAIGVPVFAADIKGDLSGLAQAGAPHRKIAARVEKIGIPDFGFAPARVAFWDLFAERGVPIRVTISELGPLLLSRLLDLNETQTGILYATFRIADDHGFLLLDLDDLRSMLLWAGENAKTLKLEYGYLSGRSIAAIQRRLLILEEQGAAHVFGEPVIDLEDLIGPRTPRAEVRSAGVINILDATVLSQRSPHLYACFLFWLLSELYEELPEVGDREYPRLVLFFDEAHLLFKRSPRALLDKVEQVVRLIRSKGVGVVFVTQSPLDIPDPVLGQLGMKIQHALRAHTPKDKRALKLVAESFRPKPGLDTAQVITELGIGEALVSTLDEEGQPTPVERTLIRPPRSQIGPIDSVQRQTIIDQSPLSARYAVAINRDSAHEELRRRAELKEQKRAVQTTQARTRSSRRQTVGEAFVKSVARSIGTQLGRRIVRGILGSLFGRA